MNAAPPVATLVDLPARHRVILCDLWGCVHDGVHVYPEAQQLLSRWRDQGRTVLLLTNAPRPASAVRRQLDGLRLDAHSYDAIVTSGEVGLAALRAEGRKEAGFIGTAADRQALTGAGIRLLGSTEGEVVVCSGLLEGRAEAADHADILAAMRERNATLLCFNPDRVVMRGGVAEPCAGALGERYEAMGGTTIWYGKPYAPIYNHALARAAEILGRPVQRDEVLAIGDSVSTDYVGATLAGLAFVFVTGGIENGRFGPQAMQELLAGDHVANELRLPPPLAVVSKLG